MAIGIMDAFEQTTTSIRNWAESKLKSGLDVKVDKVQGKGLSEKNYSESDKNKVDNMPDNLVLIGRELYLGRGEDPIPGTQVTLPAGGGGGDGPGPGSTSVTATAISSQEFSVAFGAPEVWIKIKFTSNAIATGTAYIKDPDGHILGREKIDCYDVSNINIAKYVKSAFNTLFIWCQDDYGNSVVNPLKYEITAVKLSFVPSFNDAVAVKSKSFTVNYTIQGTGYKKVHFIFNGVDQSVVVTSDSTSASKSINIGDSTAHGVYTLRVYAETILSEDVNSPREDEIIRSDIYEYCVMYAIGATPLIGSVCTVDSAEQYAPISIPFSVYDRDNDRPIVDLIISQNGMEYSRTTMVAPENEKVVWPARVAQLLEGFSLNENFDFTLSYPGASPVTYPIKITPSSMNVSVRQDNLLFELTSADKSNSSDREWHSNVGDVDVTLDNITWNVQDTIFTITGVDADGNEIQTQRSYAIGTGWRRDEENNIALRLSGDARATVNFQPFAEDWAEGGATFEMEFAIRDVNKRDATPISCMANNLGFKVTADTASLIKANEALVKCNYVDDEKVRVTFVLENYIGPKNNPVQLITAYLNGVLSSAVNFTKVKDVEFLYQNPAAYISIGSPDCSIDLYMMRFYDAPLSYNEIKNNYIADHRRYDLWAENQIYVENEIVFDKLVDKIPIIRTTGIRPESKNETKPENKGGEGKDRRVDVIYTNRTTTPVIKEDRVKIHVQGTSSEGYIRKNYDLDFENNYQHADGQMSTDYFCLKTDYAEATGTHNTGHANYVHTLYTPDKFSNKLPFSIDSRARTTIYGFPCVVFHRDDSSDPNYTFSGKYNFNFSKDSENVFGFTATDENGNRKYPRSQSWEFAENKYDPCKFLTDPNTIPEGEGTKENPGWETCFEDRCKPESGGITDFKDLYRWVYYTDQTKANPSSAIDPYTKQPIGQYLDPFDNKTIHTHDTAAYRRAKFRKEFEEHFDLDFTLVYYVYTFVMLMVDQRAKNQFLTSWDGKIWAPWLYDNDTSFGINNQGYLRFDYYHEDYGNNSVLEQTDVYNGKDSVLWVNFADAFQDKIATTYASWRSGKDPLLSYDKIVNNFITKHSDQWSISIYNEDAEYKYISMYRSDGDADNLYQVRGTGEEHLKYFIKNRLMYCDSKWGAGDFTNKDTNTIRLRINAPQIAGELAPNPLLKYKTFSNMYAGVGSGAKEGISASKYVTTNDWAEFELTVTNGQNNLDVYIFGAGEISEIEDMSLLYCDLITISAASKLTRLIVGNDNPNYRNDNLKTLSFTNNRLLREVNVCNCKGLTTTLDFSLCPDIQKIYATGSGITGVVLPSSGFLKEITLPKIDSLIITNQNRINKFECEGYENLTTLKIENSTMVIVRGNNEIESTDRFPLQEILLGCDIDLLRSVNIKDVKWNVDSEANLETIINKLIQKQGFVLEGSVYVLNGATVSDELKVLIHQHFPKLNVIDNNPLFYVDYYKYDGTFWDTETVRQGQNAKGPDKGNPPNVIMDEQGTRHLFVKWLSLPTDVQKNCTVNAEWQTQYAVSFYSEDGTTRYHRDWYDADETPSDPVETGKISAPTKSSSDPDTRYKFNGWALSPNSTEPLDALPVLKNVINFYATFIEQYPVRFYKTSRKETPAVLYGDVQWVINGQDAILPADPTKASTDQYSYKFSGWDGKHTEIKGATNIYANYTPQERTYTVHFYNDTQWLHTATNISYTRTLKPEDLYDYEDIKKEINGVPSDDYDCKGWLSKLISEESIVNCYAVFRYNAYIEQSWQTIINDANSKSVDELKELYPIGARKKVTFTAENGDIVESMDIKWTSNNKTTTYTDVTIDMEVIAYQHDDLADNPGKKASLTFFCKDLPNITMNRYDTGNTYHGWGESSIRDFLNNTLYSYFSDELKSTNGIKSVIKQSDDGNLKQSKLATTSDKCWVASTSEIGFDTLGSKVVQGQGTLYSETFSADSIDAGKARASRQKLSPDGVNCGSWHTRTTYLTDTGMYYTVQSSGASYEQGAWANCYVAFGFCI